MITANGLDIEMFSTSPSHRRSTVLSLVDGSLYSRDVRRGSTTCNTVIGHGLGQVFCRVSASSCNDVEMESRRQHGNERGWLGHRQHTQHPDCPWSTRMRGDGVHSGARVDAAIIVEPCEAVRSSGAAPRARPMLRLGQPSRRHVVCCACIERRVDFAPCEACNVQSVNSAVPDWPGGIAGAPGCIQVQAR
jgi:hypothetical protein